MAEQDDDAIARVRAQSRAVENALSDVLGLPVPEEGNLAWVTVPLRTPTTLAGLMMVLSQKSGYELGVMYANVLMRGLWALGSEENLPEVARAAALLIHGHSSDENWQHWSKKYPRAKEYVDQEEAEDG